MRSSRSSAGIRFPTDLRRTSHAVATDESWMDVVDEGSSSDEDQEAVPTQRSKRNVSTTSNMRSSKRLGSKVSSPYNTSFVMPKLEREVSFPKQRRKKTETFAPVPAPERERTSSRSKKVQPAQNQLVHGIQQVSLKALMWFLEIVLGSLQVIKTPLKYALGLYLLVGMIVIASNAVTSRVSAALTPICRLPGSSYILPSLCTGSSSFFDDTSSEQSPDPEFDHLMTVQRKFEDLLQQSVDYYAIPSFMKHSQSAMRDVREVVRYSPIESKNELLLELDTYVSAASQASWDLESFNSHIGRTVDRIMLTARWTQKMLDDVASQNDTMMGTVAQAVNAVIWPFQPVKATENTVRDLYIQHSDEVQSEIADLLTEAQAVYSLLKSLEDTVDNIHGITARDTHYANVGRDEVFGELWSKLGGNSKQKATFATQLRVLEQVSTYSSTAYTSISEAILKLQTMSVEIDQLKARLRTVDVVGSGNRQHVPLSVHLENIQLGVERLEEARGYARDARFEKSRSVISAGRDRYGDEVHGVPQGRKIVGEKVREIPGS